MIKERLYLNVIIINSNNKWNDIINTIRFKVYKNIKINK
jgi:hypothetical protein